ncbi:hypothetical protein [Solicola gregarius]|uniref:CHRD domain-containing protein n=1 Tax=Solicola gregarius TaxID=2908642 RepID=A0AA46TEW6_9ACTN|nr:hypothetical protein [Solicola gregarius]UYM03604.1 hypothetical protein L0C25_13695 [Solicola gregarius]
MSVLASGVLVGGLLASTGSASATDGDGSSGAPGAVGAKKTRTHLAPINNSGVRGTARVKVHNRRLTVSVNAHGLLRKMPHAMHLHFAKKARHTCPTVRDDKNADHRLNTTEGTGAYGNVRVSLTKSGATGPKSALAVKRFPTAPRGKIHYSRTLRTSKAVARGVRNGNSVLVVHGIDYNHNRKYDFKAGKSDLDPKLPTEATDPVACGVLRTNHK